MLESEVLEWNNIFELMPRICAWQESTELINLVCSRFTRLLSERLSGVFNEIEKTDLSGGKWLRSAFDALPSRAAKRFLTAPETCARMRAREITAEISFFRAALVAEQILNGDYSEVRGCWSALGDFYFSEGTAIDPLKEAWDGKSSLAAPHVGSLMVLDLMSPNAQQVQPMKGLFDPYSVEEASALRASIEKALTTLEAISKNAASFVEGFIRTIIVRKDTSRLHGTTSSQSAYIGRVLIRNGQKMDTGELAEGLVHEAIHAMLSMLTLEQRMIADGSGAKRTMIQSPWTGQMLPLEAYIHACFVWYGLSKLWAAAMASNVLPFELVEKNLARALCGFRVANPAENLAPYATLVHPEVMKTASCLSGLLESELRLKI